VPALTFIYNKYTRIYYNIIERAKTRPVFDYTEKHHIIPRSLGGDNSADNLIRLTAREHFVCHLLLTRMTQGQYKRKMISAVFYLTGQGKSKRNNNFKRSRLYENLKRQHSVNVSEQKKGCRQPPRSAVARQRYSESKQGKSNPNYKGSYITPWGCYESSRMAAKACPDRMSDVAILNFCQQKNNIPISYLSVCRSKGYLQQKHIGLTPREIGFDFKINT
jgi:hypothetical protein